MQSKKAIRFVAHNCITTHNFGVILECYEEKEKSGGGIKLSQRIILWCELSTEVSYYLSILVSYCLIIIMDVN